MASTSETSSTKSEARPIRTFATFRLAGDDLDPTLVTRTLKRLPTHAHARGERFSGGPRSENLKGRTGVWYFSTDRSVASERLADHLDFLVRFLFQDERGLEATRLSDMKRLIDKTSSKAVVSCFWDGPGGAKPPSVPRGIAAIFALIGARIETDFDTDARPEHRSRSASAK